MNFRKIRLLFIVALLFGCSSLFSQSIELSGNVIASGDVEGIHVINVSYSRFTTTNEFGEFTIPARVNDTLKFTGIKYEVAVVVLSPLLYQTKTLEVVLKDNINVLDEVIIGEILTGDLLLDLENSDAKPGINFYDLGLPGYKGKPKTQSERRLFEATSGGGFIPLNPILNGISGRTKMLKNQVRLERQDKCMNAMRSEFSEILFRDNYLEEDLRSEYFYFCADHEDFRSLCDIDNEMEILMFLQNQLKAYKANRAESRDN
ncbi:MAG: hypothetical protein BM564_10985 [Bacteroidetes bacterium MedPE-SWsnd-G2]|nr:MAG: hypothetical protein BM564_10985 [Bacteroidetes bacterium MedPE-SWsnd-G2]